MTLSSNGYYSLSVLSDDEAVDVKNVILLDQRTAEETNLGIFSELLCLSSLYTFLT